MIKSPKGKVPRRTKKNRYCIQDFGRMEKNTVRGFGCKIIQMIKTLLKKNDYEYIMEIGRTIKKKGKVFWNMKTETNTMAGG